MKNIYSQKINISKNISKNIFKFITNLSNLNRKLILIILDFILLNLSFVLVNYFYPDLFFLRDNLLLSLILIPFFILTGQYNSLARFIGSKSIYSLLIRNTAIIFLYFFISNNYSLKGLILLWFFISFLLCSIRIILRDLYIFLKSISERNFSNIVIYGAGEAGVQLANALRFSYKYKVIAFIDDSEKLWGRYINGIKVQSFNFLDKESQKIDKMVIAIPSITTIQRKSLVKRLTRFKNIKLFETPNFEKFRQSLNSKNSLREINIEELLGRETLLNNFDIKSLNISQSNICVTGAGGSIGSELCKQISNANPKTIILIELSEYNLYKIYNELLTLNKDSDTKIIPILGDTKDYNLIKKVFSREKVDLIYHAAAYKHVPLVEANPLQGINNNVYSTLTLCKVAQELNIKQLTLISSDKAVRPKNVMGASKRIAELILLYFSSHFSESKISKTKFSIVRFGNVIGSSGSVVPLFNNQIDNGAALTITHPDIIRYFMTIPEAVQLVLRASKISLGGEIFVLDMGEPVKIKDLAINILKARNLTLKDENTPEGDIEIIYTGLRPGEKLYEELTLDGSLIRTEVDLIFRANEKASLSSEIIIKIEELLEQIKLQDKEKTFEIMSQIVPEWTLN